MGYCKIHKNAFGWCCAICDEEWLYAGRTNLIEFFRQGIRGEKSTATTIQEIAAYEHGITFFQPVKGEKEGLVIRSVNKPTKIVKIKTNIFLTAKNKR